MSKLSPVANYTFHNLPVLYKYLTNIAFNYILTHKTSTIYIDTCLCNYE